MTLKQMYLAIFDPDPMSYFSLLHGEELHYWSMPCRGSTLWSSAWNYKPRYKSLTWLAKIILVRMILPYLLFFGSVFLVILLALILLAFL